MRIFFFGGGLSAQKFSAPLQKPKAPPPPQCPPTEKILATPLSPRPHLNNEFVHENVMPPILRIRVVSKVLLGPFMVAGAHILAYFVARIFSRNVLLFYPSISGYMGVHEIPQVNTRQNILTPPPPIKKGSPESYPNLSGLCPNLSRIIITNIFGGGGGGGGNSAPALVSYAHGLSSTSKLYYIKDVV